MLEISGLTPAKLTRKAFVSLLRQAVATREWMTRNIYESRAKDYENPFRTMVYDTAKEMEKVIGSIKDNSFIKQQQEQTAAFRKTVDDLLEKWEM